MVEESSCFVAREPMSLRLPRRCRDSPLSLALSRFLAIFMPGNSKRKIERARMRGAEISSEKKDDARRRASLSLSHSIMSILFMDSRPKGSSLCFFTCESERVRGYSGSRVFQAGGNPRSIIRVRKLITFMAEITVA